MPGAHIMFSTKFVLCMQTFLSLVYENVVVLFKYKLDFVITKNISFSSDLIMNFNVSPLFTKIHIKDTLKLLKRHFSEDIVKLFRYCLTPILYDIINFWDHK